MTLVQYIFCIAVAIEFIRLFVAILDFRETPYYKEPRNGWERDDAF